MKRPAQLLLRTGPYVIALVVLAVLRQSGLAQMIDLTTYDLVIRHKEAPSGLDSPITLIGIEESVFRGMDGQSTWPVLPRHRHPAERWRQCNWLRSLPRSGVGPEQQCLRDRFRDEPTLVSIFNVAAGIPAVQAHQLSGSPLTISAWMLMGSTS